jgi:hypothetical protein
MKTREDPNAKRGKGKRKIYTKREESQNGGRKVDFTCFC